MMIEIRHENMTETSKILKAYNSIYESQGISQHDSFYLWLISLLKPGSGSLLLDISCGEGRQVSLAHRQGLFAFGMDFSESAVRIRSADCPGANWTVCDGEILPLLDTSIDYITHIGSLEHYADPEAGIAEIARVLKPSGVACVLLPNSYGLFGNRAQVLDTLAEIQFLRGDRKGALATAEKAVEMDPGNPWYRKQVGRFGG